jgi:predicted CXXCH cytochrome family protein
MFPMSTRAWVTLGVAVLAIFNLGCETKEKIVYRDRAPFNPPPDEASGFLGYYTPEEQFTTCGNCHVSVQGEWSGTAHANAVATLEASGHAQSFCYPCHTISGNGNAADEPAGYSSVQTPVYHDVQCESCHGAGIAHVESPSKDTIPKPTLAVPADFSDGCAECHNGEHHPFAEDWVQSKHANLNSYPAGRPECGGCHRGQGILEAWGVRGSYKEKDSAEHLMITCGVCHDPHSAVNEGQLRHPVNTNSIETHLCARCHNRRTEPDIGSSHGLEPHAPEADLLVGVAGWFPPGSNIDQGEIIGSHGSEGNPTLCAACHVQSYEITDAATGEFLFNSTGHLFTAVPCVDANGIPVQGDCDYDAVSRSYVGCATAGCHSTEGSAATVLESAVLLTDTFAADLMSQINQVDPAEIDATDPVFTVAKGALFNYNLSQHGGSSVAASAHNPFLIRALLLASITAMEDEYGVSPTSNIDHRRELRDLLEYASR